MARFRVLWGDPFHGLDQVVVDAYDLDEAFVTAHELRPDLLRPRVGFLIGASELLA
ncbi:MAG TPA: hypothetical protein VFN54_09915 [Acidimicrobiales bacterium]|nr:hypothetical protein [Acidimicrobiales bacterium]